MPPAGVNITNQAGDGMQVRLSSRGAVFDDLDKDGAIDVAVLNSHREPTILQNETAVAHHWLQVEPVSVASNRAGVGAQVRVKAGNLVQRDEVHSGRG